MLKKRCLFTSEARQAQWRPQDLVEIEEAPEKVGLAAY